MAKTKRREWWQSFFRGAWIDYQLTMDRADEVRRVADFLEAVLDLAPKSSILDAPCGEGRMAREFARRGHAVTGVDVTPALLRAAKRRARADKLAVDWVHGDMREPPGRARYDLALCWWGSFGYFDDAENLRHAQAMHKALKPGGSFVVNVHTPETLFPRFLERDWTEAGGVLVLSENDYDADSGRVETDWTLVKGTRRSRAHSSIRLYTLHELRELCLEAGFARCESWGDLEGEPFGLDSRRLAFAAFK